MDSLPLKISLDYTFKKKHFLENNIKKKKEDFMANKICV